MAHPLAANGLILLSACLALVPLQYGAAQSRFGRDSDSSEPTSTNGLSRTSSDKFKRALAGWERVDDELDQITNDARVATLQKKDLLRPRYVSLVTQAKDLLSELREVGREEYRAQPNQDPLVTRTMLGLLAHDVQTDDVEAAMEIAADLIVNRCEHISLYNLAGRAAYCANDFDRAEELLEQARELGAIEKQAEIYLRDLDLARRRWKEESQIRQHEFESDDLPRVALDTTQGTIVLELFENEAPQTVGNFIHLVESHFYDGKKFHRVVANFMAQSGCPKGDGTGGPGYSIFDETGREDHRSHFRGTLTMAKTPEPNSGGSQFFITFRPAPELDGLHTVFGRVIEGMHVLSQLHRREATNLSEPDRIVRAEVIRKRPRTDYKPTKTR